MFACKPSPYKIADDFVREKAVHPSSIKIISRSAVLRQEHTKLDTFYYIAAIAHDTVFSDSIRIETHTYPEHYYCCYKVSCIDDCGQPNECLAELAIFPDGTAIFYNKYRDIYYGATESDTRAQRDTLTNIRTPSFYNKSGVWALKQMLLNNQ
jgi:hypothetical protein